MFENFEGRIPTTVKLAVWLEEYLEHVNMMGINNAQG